MYFSRPKNLDYSITLLIVLLLFVSSVLGHGRMMEPQIRIAPGDENNGFTLTNGPTKVEPCAGNPPGPVLNQFQPGQTVPIKWKITAAHRGSCSVQLSTTGQDTDFKELKSFPNCADTNGDFEDVFKLPVGVTCSRCTIRWQWNALLTNELYLNCADVKIGGGSSPGEGGNDTIASTTSTTLMKTTILTTPTTTTKLTTPVTSTTCTTSEPPATSTRFRKRHRNNKRGQVSKDEKEEGNKKRQEGPNEKNREINEKNQKMIKKKRSQT